MPHFAFWVTVAIVWIAFAFMTLEIIRDINPSQRRITRSLLVRIVMVLGGPLTWVIFLICLGLLLAAESATYELEELPVLFRKFFAPSR